ncbi:MAG: hypothetical protein K0R93_1234 [Anaerosolibacter sp.]|jgi:hypothetical protein|nr:hypothetical protein [Anaerosolibacter sp.]
MECDTMLKILKIVVTINCKMLIESLYILYQKNGKKYRIINETIILYNRGYVWRWN